MTVSQVVDAADVPPENSKTFPSHASSWENASPELHLHLFHHIHNSKHRSWLPHPIGSRLIYSYCSNAHKKGKQRVENVENPSQTSSSTRAWNKLLSGSR